MADGTHIEWTDATWNPVTGCSVVSPGCTNCYAMRLAGGRLRHHPSRAGLTEPSKAGPVWNGQVRFNEAWLDEPLRWKRPRRIFVCAHGDLFHEAVPDAWIDKIFAVMALSQQHSFQVLTKRAERMREYVRALPGDPAVFDRLAALAHDIGSTVRGYRGSAGQCARPLRNVWLGVSAEDQVRAEERIPALLDTPAAKRFVSLEPLLGPIDLASAIYTGEGGVTMRGYLRDAAEADDFHHFARKLDWVIVGGENGPRPMDPAWARQIRDACARSRVPFFFKQWGDWVQEDQAPSDVEWEDTTPAHYFDAGETGPAWRLGKRWTGRLLDGVTHDGAPV